MSPSKWSPWEFMPLLKGPGTGWHDSPTPHSARKAWIWQQSDACLGSLSECSKLTQIKFPTCYELHGYWFFCFQGQLDTHFHLFCWSANIPYIQYLQQRSHCFRTWKTTHRLMFFLLFALWKLLSTFQKCLYHFPQFNVQLDADTLFYQAYHFLLFYYLRGHYSLSILATAVFQTEWLSRLYCIYA